MNSLNRANGKENRRWCDGCGTLILGSSCSVCGSAGREFRINSPGDIRPCFGDSVDIVCSLFEEAFGTSAPFRDVQMFFNKVSGDDRAEEVIAHGRVVQVLRFDLREGRMKIDLKQGGAELLAPLAHKNVVHIGGVLGHVKGKGVQGSCVTLAEGRFAAGDPLIIIKGDKVGAGVANVPSDGIRGEGKTVRVKDLDLPSGIPQSPAAGRDVFVRCNTKHLRSLEAKAVQEIRRVIGRRTATVAFSGGKDSLAAYGLAAAAVGTPELIFTDTGLEFPDTVRYVDSFARKNRLVLHKACGKDGFWKNLDAFGPPAKDFRWCCKVCKLGPITDLIARDFPGGAYTVEGKRRLESFNRAHTKRTSHNPFIPNQMIVSPVREWCAAEVWGYIWMKGLEYNPLYDRDFERLGCYLCPASMTSEWMNTRRIYPELYGEWDAYLRRYAADRGLPPEYVDMGFWRWKSLPPKMKVLASELDVRTGPEKGDLSLRMLKGASVCAAGGFSAEAVLTVPGNAGFESMACALATVGPVRIDPEYGIAMVDARRGRAKVFAGGQLSVTSDTEEGARTTLGRVIKALVRAEMCTSCRICQKVCPKKAVKISGGLRIDPEVCNQCGRCEPSCMVVRYADKLMSGMDVPAVLRTGGRGTGGGRKGRQGGPGRARRPRRRPYILYRARRWTRMGMEVFYIATALSLVPTLLVMFILLRPYTFPKVEQPFFSDPTFFLYFAVGLVAGTVMFAVFSFIMGSLIPILLYAVIQVVVPIMLMNLRKYRGKSDSVFYGFGLGLGMGCATGTGYAYYLASISDFFPDAAMGPVDWALVAVVVLAMVFQCSAVGITVGEAIARHQLTEYGVRAAVANVVFFVLFVIMALNTESEVLMFVLSGAMLSVATVYLYKMYTVDIAAVAQEVLEQNSAGHGKRHRPKLRSDPVASVRHLVDHAAVEHQSEDPLPLYGVEPLDILLGELAAEEFRQVVPDHGDLRLHPLRLAVAVLHLFPQVGVPSALAGAEAHGVPVEALGDGTADREPVQCLPGMSLVAAACDDPDPPVGILGGTVGAGGRGLREVGYPRSPACRTLDHGEHGLAP